MIANWFSLPGKTLFSPPKPSLPPPPAPLPEKDDVAEKAKKRAQDERRRRGFGQTILTQPKLGDVAAPVQRATLLGRAAS